MQPLAAVEAMLAARAPHALRHTDAVQGFAWLDVRERCAGYDLVTVSAHKFGGPKGAGLLVVRRRARPVLAPQLRGGGQEHELRAGTQNVAAIVAMAVAARITAAERAATAVRVAALRDRLADALVARVGAQEPGPRADRVAGNCHLRFPGVSGEELVVLADRDGVAASTGSACASGAREPSHVLLAMGWDAASARQAVRLTLGASTTMAEVDHAIAVLTGAVERLRAG
jgi:cysteine desulfurase